MTGTEMLRGWFRDAPGWILWLVAINMAMSAINGLRLIVGWLS